MRDDFSLDRLRALVTHPCAVMRHDIDFDLNAALEMAELESHNGVTSTYYLMARSEEYNALSRNARHIVYAIGEMGHDIGLHVNLHCQRDVDVPEWYAINCIVNDFLSMRSAYPELTRKVSFHKPPHSALWRDLADWELALTQDWEHHYVSDSRGVFRTNPEAALAKAQANGEQVQLNLHPEWWFWHELRADRQREVEAVAA